MTISVDQNQTKREPRSSDFVARLRRSVRKSPKFLADDLASRQDGGLIVVNAEATTETW